MKHIFVVITMTLVIIAHSNLLFSANPFPATSLLNSTVSNPSEETHQIVREGAQRILGLNLNYMYSKRVKKELEKASQQSDNSSGARQLEKRLQLRKKLAQNRLSKQN